jgi:hypothetical protein
MRFWMRIVVTTHVDPAFYGGRVRHVQLEHADLPGTTALIRLVPNTWHDAISILGPEVGLGDIIAAITIGEVLETSVGIICCCGW